jgi:hypothetical protein
MDGCEHELKALPQGHRVSVSTSTPCQHEGTQRRVGLTGHRERARPCAIDYCKKPLEGASTFLEANGIDHSEDKRP